MFDTADILQGELEEIKTAISKYKENLEEKSAQLVNARAAIKSPSSAAELCYLAASAAFEYCLKELDLIFPDSK